MKKPFLTLAVLFLMLLVFNLTRPAIAATPSIVQDALIKAIQSQQRTPAFVKRDRYRHPLKTLEFFGIYSNMRVIEVLPGAGYYTEILASFLHNHGTLIEATPAISDPNPFMRKEAIAYQRKLTSDPAVYGRIRLEPFDPPLYIALGAPDSADMILTFLNMHDFMYANVHGNVTDVIINRFFRNAFQTLKPGGILGLVAHRAPNSMSTTQSFKFARLPQAFVIREAERAGFRLAATSEINTNPKDPRNIPVFDLPPVLMKGTKDRAKYEAIGPADDMTLKFVKPAKISRK